MISIFGSCRQDALYDYFSVSAIRDHLTYPHYTKEILQAIEFCRGDIAPSNDLINIIFRSAIINKKNINQKLLTQAYNKTNLIVIEVASKICYKYQGYYCHHIITEEKYGFIGRDLIEVYDQTDEEIESDILKIRDLVSPKKLMIVSHFYTKLNGKRYDLVKLLEYICNKHNINFFDPVKFTNTKDSKKIYLQEPVLAHYSEYGRSIISSAYKDYISKEFNLKPKVWIKYKRLISNKMSSNVKSIIKQAFPFLHSV